MDLIREILLRGADSEHGTVRTSYFVSERHAERSVAQHFQLLEDKELATVNLFTHEAYGPLQGKLERLTWDGYDYLRLVESNTAWNYIKGTALSKGVALTFDLVKAFGTQYLRQQAGLSE
jgi:hypothetical protein